MKYLIISFKSRNEVYGFAKYLKQNNIFCSIINTPKSIGSSCMLSIKTDFNNISLISAHIKTYKSQTFLGVYSIQNSIYGKQTIRLI